ncbi:MAG: TMEM43 family protein [Rhizobiaceae bacterium]|nr:TMEM43 family protein [Rhizobiaceae bacterium]
MSDTFSVTTRRSWFSRLGNSVVGVIIGLVLLVAMVVLLFWNEGRAVQTARSLTEGAGIVTSVPADIIEPGNEGRLVHVTGDVETWHKPTDQTFGITAEGIRLERKSEMYQWKETSKSDVKEKLGGAEETVTTYSYSKVWNDRPIDSARFKNPAGHDNPPMEIRSQEFQVPEAGLGAFELSQRLMSMIGGARDVSISPDLTSAIETAYSGTKRVAVADGRIYLGFNSTQPAVGDYRISYRLVPLGTVSVIGKQSGHGFQTYQTQAGDALLMIETGNLPADQMFESAQSANTVMTWILRVVGVVFLWIGFALLMSPLRIVAAVIPFLGRLVGAGTSIAALLLAVLVGTVTIAIAWFWYRPLLSLAIIVAGFAIAYAVGKVGKARGKTSVPVEPQAA